MTRRVLFILVPLLAAGLLGAIAGSAATGLVRVPRVSELDTYRPDIITEIRASDGTTIARYAIERRIVISRAEIPAVVRNAIVATEDKNFFRHGGVDLARTVSAVASDVRQQRYAQGGSTLTQQLARAIFLSPRKALSRKINEYFVTFEIERRYSKDQIRTLYANEIYLGHGNYGFEAAARYYFGKSLKNVTLAEAALLAGIVHRPEDQSPFRNPALARARRSTALRRMRAENYITEAQRVAAEAAPLPSARRGKKPSSSPPLLRGDPPVPGTDLRGEDSTGGDARGLDARPGAPSRSPGEALGWGLRHWREARFSQAEKPCSPGLQGT